MSQILVSSDGANNSGDARWADGGGVISTESSWKEPVQLATLGLGPVSLSPATDPIDGVALAVGYRVAVVEQGGAATPHVDNGLYEFDGVNLVRTADFATGAEEQAGVKVYVQSGTTNAEKTLVLNSPTTPLVVGTDGTEWKEDGGGGGGGEDLAATLAIGNTSGGTGIEMSTILGVVDEIHGQDAAGGSGDDGGDLLLRWGLGDGAGVDGAIRVDAAGDPRGARAVDLQGRRSAANQVASGYEAILLGGYNNRIEGTDYASLAFGGKNTLLDQAGGNWTIGNVLLGYSNTFDLGGGFGRNLIHGAYNNFSMYAGSGRIYDAFISGYSHDNASGNYMAFYSAAMIGSQMYVDHGSFRQGILAGTGMTIGGYINGTAAFGAQHQMGGAGLYHNLYNCLLWGRNAQVIQTADLEASLIGGDMVKVEAPGGLDLSHVFAWGDTTHATITGEVVWANESSARQGSMLQMQAVTTNATPTVMLSRVSGGAGENIKYTIRSGQAHQFYGTVVAKETTTGDSKSWLIDGLIKNIAGTTTLVGSNVTLLHQDAGAAAWTVALVADDADDELEITATGEVGKTIQWNSFEWGPHAGTAT